MLNISERKSNDVTELILEGRFDAMTSASVEDRLGQMMDAGHLKLAVDLGKTDYISSAGLRVLLAALKRARASGGDVRLVITASHIRHVFELAGFAQLFRIFASSEEAVASFQ